MKLYETLIMSFFDIISIFIIVKSLLNEKIKFFSVIIYGGIFSVLTGYIGYNLVEPYGLIVNGILIILMLIIIFKKSILKSIYIYIIASIIILLIQLLIIAILGLLFDKFEYNFLYGFISQLLSISIIALFTYFMDLKVIISFIDFNNKTFKYIIMNVFIILFFSLIYWNINFQGFFENMISFSVLALLLIYMNFGIFKNGLRNKYMERELDIYKTYNPIINDLIDDIKSRQHDFDNQIQSLSILIRNNDLLKDDNELIEYIGDLKSKNSLGDLIKLNSRLVASALYIKKLKADQKKIPFNIKIMDYSIETKLRDFELVEILNILINNALETEVLDNDVYVEIKKEKQKNVVIVKNKHSYLTQNQINNMFKKGFSTKENSNKRGYGLYNLSKIIKKVNGRISIKNEGEDENYVVIKVVFD